VFYAILLSWNAEVIFFSNVTLHRVVGIDWELFGLKTLASLILLYMPRDHLLGHALWKLQYALCGTSGRRGMG
jgi:hypothetical protein